MHQSLRRTEKLQYYTHTHIYEREYLLCARTCSKGFTDLTNVIVTETPVTQFFSSENRGTEDLIGLNCLAQGHRTSE